MRTALDFSPLHRSSIGFDRIFALLENAQTQPTDNWPPFDTVRLSEDSYRIAMAVAGFKADDIDITTQENTIVIKGERKTESEGEYFHRGIACRPFIRRFELAEHVKVVNAQLSDGLLTIELKREIPEAMKPHRIQVHSAAMSASNIKQIEQHAAA